MTLKDLGWLFLSKIISMCLGFFSIVFYYNYLGPEKVGLLAFLSVLLFYFGLIPNDIATNNLAIKYEQGAEEKNSFFTASVVFKLMVGLCFFFLFSGYILFFLKENSSLAFLFSLSLIFTPLLVFSSFLEFSGKFALIAKIDLFIAGLNFLIILLLVNIKSNLTWFIVIQVFLPVLRNSMMGIAAFRKGMTLNFTGLKKNLAILCGDYWPLVISAVIVAFFLRIDQLMLEHYSGLYYLGIYSLVVNLLEKPYFVPMTLSSYLYPRFAAFDKDEEFSGFTLKISNISLPFLGLFILLAVLFSPEISGIFSKNYPPEIFTDTFIALSFSFIGVYTGAIFSRVEILFGQQKRQTLFFFIMFLANIILNFFLIPKFNSIGAAISTTVCYSFIPFLNYFLMPRMKMVYSLLLLKYFVLWTSSIAFTLIYYIYLREAPFLARFALFLFLVLILTFLFRKTVLRAFPLLGEKINKCF